MCEFLDNLELVLERMCVGMIGKCGILRGFWEDVRGERIVGSDLLFEKCQTIKDEMGKLIKYYLN